MHAKLRATLGNRLSYPGEPGYEEARRVWNAMHDRRPALVARCRSAAEVSLTLRYAVAVGLRVTVRGGGHNVAGTAVADDALMVDLSLMRDVVVDPTERLAVAEGDACSAISTPPPHRTHWPALRALSPTPASADWRWAAAMAGWPANGD